MDILNGPIYHYGDNRIYADLEAIRKEANRVYKRSGRNTIYYWDLPAAFDIETTSFYDDDGNKRAIMYCWQVGIGGVVILGREWVELVELLERVGEIFHTRETRLIIYVHNLAYEFQWIRKWLAFDSVFALSSRKVCYAVTDTGIEFRCSYILTQKSLEKVGKDLTRYQVRKLTGVLDYTKKRHTQTELTPYEWSYCINDVIVVMAAIQEKIEDDGSIAGIPLTNTGYVRKFCREACTKKTADDPYKSYNYHRLMTSITLSPDEYRQLKRAFMGGYTHANALHSRDVIEDVTSYDFTSSYPAVMIACSFPMSRATIVQPKDRRQLRYYLDRYHCVFNVEFEKLQSRDDVPDTYLSLSKCDAINPILDNGRIRSADRVRTTLTELDFEIVQRCYTWDNLRVGEFRTYIKGYLPTDFVGAILELYRDKTTLKGVAGAEVEYLIKKGMLNSAYGMCATDICRDEIVYADGDWSVQFSDVAERLDFYNDSRGRFLCYQWAVYVTAWARYNLWSGILACGDDYIYADTDSIKIMNAEKHRDYIDKYNQQITDKITEALNYHGITGDYAKPRTITGELKPMGVWDFDGHYKKFKTIGAKRYLTQDDKGTYHMTVAGVSKKTGAPYMEKTYGSGIWEAFDDDLVIPAGDSGKLVHSYIDFETTGYLTDYKGNRSAYHEKSSIHLDSAPYHLSLGAAYLEFLEGYEKEYDRHGVI